MIQHNMSCFIFDYGCISRTIFLYVLLLYTHSRIYKYKNFN